MATEQVPAYHWAMIRALLRDVQFWIPVVVLLAGVLVLRWVS